jgi:hypothetical protein
MRFRTPGLLLLLASAALGGGGCATSEQWAEWRSHSSHFASGDHLFFSMKHQGVNPTPKVRSRDVETARAQTWWGEPIVVRPDQLFSG